MKGQRMMKPQSLITGQGLRSGRSLNSPDERLRSDDNVTRSSELPAHAQRLRRIEGRHNPLVKELRQAFAHAERTEDGDCAIEGLRIVEEAIRSGLRFRAVFFNESAQNLAERLLPQIGAQRRNAAASRQTLR